VEFGEAGNGRISICVPYTAADARVRNFQVTVLKDGVATFDEQAHCCALRETEKTLGVDKSESQKSGAGSRYERVRNAGTALATSI
jgi:nicotinamidase-related amidase